MVERKKKSAAAARGRPHSEEMEKGLLGSLLLAPDRLDELGWLRGEHFYAPRNCEILTQLRAMGEGNKPISLVSLCQWLEDHNILEEVGGAEYITELFNFVPTASNANYYAEIILEKATRRGIIEAAEKLISSAYEDNDISPQQMLENCESELVRLRKDATYGDAMEPISASVVRVMDELEKVFASRGRTAGLATGFHDFDRMSGGLKPGQMMIIGARPSVGKSAMAMQLARYFATQVPVAIFSLEMSTDSLVTRLLCAEANLNLRFTRDGFLSAQMRDNISKSGAAMSNWPIWIDQTGEMTALDWRARARRVKQKHGVKVILIDYLQRLNGDSKQARENRTQEVREVSLAVTAMAKQLEVLMVVCAQLTRDADSRPEPKLIDLKESGQIEQDADIVWLMQRLGDKQYPQMDKEEKELYDEENAGIGDSREKKDLVRIHVAKHRNNPTGTFRLFFERPLTRFKNITEDLYSNKPEAQQKIPGKKEDDGEGK
jgi:replicative DNA helicase